MISSFYSENELIELGIKITGKNVLISKKASIYRSDQITIGNNVRIDDFCILSGKVTLGNNIHIAAYSALYGGETGITIHDFANISSRVCIYAVSDDFSGFSMTNPTIPDKFKKLNIGKVEVHKHAIIGTGSTVLPGVELAEGTVIGAMSLCKHSTAAWKIYAGIPTKIIKDRSRNLLSLEMEYLHETSIGN